MRAIARGIHSNRVSTGSTCFVNESLIHLRIQKRALHRIFDMTFQTYSERRRLAQKVGEPEIYVYIEFSKQFRHQVSMAVEEGIGRYHVYSGHEWGSISEANDVWNFLHKTCVKEVFSYTEFNKNRDLRENFRRYMMEIKNTDDLLSVLEVGLKMLGVVSQIKGGDLQIRGADISGESAIAEINQRFKQHSLGYNFENGIIIREDSKIFHAEVVKPALYLLQNKIYEKPNEEYMVSHRHYREGLFKDCITAANRSFESMLKCICEKENWSYQPSDRASDLITVVSKSGLFTHAFDKGLSSYVAMLKTGLPEIRNNAGAHGDGPKSLAITVHIARYALNLTAANLLFIAECYNEINNNKY